MAVYRYRLKGSWAMQDQTSGRVVFINRFFYPDHSATSQILSDVTTDLAQHGQSITVITSRLSYDGSQEPFPKHDVWNGVNIVRIESTRFGRGNLLGRALDYVSFYLSAFLSVIFRIRSNDLVIVKTDPPLLSVPLGVAIRIKGARLVNWLQDIYPDVAEQLGVGFAGGPIGKLLKALRNRSFRRAVMNVVIGERMRMYLLDQGVAENKVSVIHNFVDDTAITPLDMQDNPVRKQWGFDEGDFVVGYSGNLGRAHDLNTILEAAEKLRDSPHIKFLFVGGGHLREGLQKQAEARGLQNLILKPYQPRDQLRQSLNVPDIHWISLLPELEGLIVPSKFYGIAASGRPVLMIGDPAGEIGRLAQMHGFGWAVSPGDSDRVAGILREGSQNKGKLKEMGAAARTLLDEQNSQVTAYMLWRTLLSDLLD